MLRNASDHIRRTMSIRKTLNSEKRKKKKIRGIKLFRSAVKKAIIHLEWLKEERMTPEEIEHKQSQRPLDFWLTYQEKLMLLKKSPHRNSEELNNLAKKLASCSAFTGFKVDEVAAVLKHVKFDYFKEGRVLVRENHVPQGVYIVIGGVAMSKQERRYFLLKHCVVRETMYYTPGRMVGESDLYFGETRKCTVVAGEPGVYTLRLNYSFFFEVYTPIRMDVQWRRLEKVFYIFRDQFSKFSNDGIKEMFEAAKFETIESGKLVEKTDKKGRHASLFIISGRVQVIQRLLLRKIGNTGSFKLNEDQNLRGPYRKNIKTVFMNTVVLKKGAVVGIGERLFRYPMIALEEVQCMRLPMSILFLQGSQYLWMKVLITMNSICPDPDALFAAYVDGLQWASYKRKVTKEFAKPRKLFRLTLHDLPISLRAQRIRFKSKILRRIVNDKDYLKGEAPFSDVRCVRYPNSKQDWDLISSGKFLYSLDDFPDIDMFDPTKNYDKSRNKIMKMKVNKRLKK